MNKEKLCGYCMIMIGAAMIFSIFAAAFLSIAYLIGWVATWLAPVIAVAFAFIINLLGYGLDKRLSK